MAMHSGIWHMIGIAPAMPKKYHPLRAFLVYRDTYRTREHTPRERLQIAYDALWFSYEHTAPADRERLMALIIRAEARDMAGDDFRLAYLGIHFI